MDLFTVGTLRWSGIFGVIGAILFITGDLLYNHIPGSTQKPAEKMSKLPVSRLLNAGLLGMIGCWLYTLASIQIYLAFRPAGGTFAVVIFLAFAVTMINYGIGHTAYFAIASGAQVAVQLGSNAETGGKLGNTFFQKVLYITYIPVGICSLMMVYGISTGRSLYPRWMVIFLPILIYLLKTPINHVLRGRLGRWSTTVMIISLCSFFLSYPRSCYGMALSLNPAHSTWEW
jgi:hypothetical protein